MSTFEERRKSLFNHLSEAEKKSDYFQKINRPSLIQNTTDVDRNTYRKVKHELKQFRGRDSIFKRPETPLRHCLTRKKLPDFVKNPNKWTYYSLEDVNDEDMSDKTNTATALAILKKYEANCQEDTMEEDVVFKKPVFKLSATVKKEQCETTELSIQSRKIIMPEYVVGVSKPKPKKEKPVQKSKLETKGNLKLDHLFEEDSDD